MDSLWRSNFPWEISFITKTSNNYNDFSSENVYITQCSFQNISSGPAVKIIDKSLCTLFDRSLFYQCSSASSPGAVEISCKQLGSVAMMRCVALMCTANSESLFAGISTDYSSCGVSNYWMTSISLCRSESEDGQKILSLKMAFNTAQISIRAIVELNSI